MATQIKVRGYHIDIFQHVNNARYLEFYESDNWAWLDKQHFHDWVRKCKLAMVVLNINVNYFRGAIIGDELTISSRVEKINAKNFICYQQITRQRKGKKEVISDALMKFAFIDEVLNKAVVIDGELLEKIKQLEQISRNDNNEFI